MQNSGWISNAMNFTPIGKSIAKEVKKNGTKT
jgi:hypothetical protein